MVNLHYLPSVKISSVASIIEHSWFSSLSIHGQPSLEVSTVTLGVTSLHPSDNVRLPIIGSLLYITQSRTMILPLAGTK